MYLAGVLLEPQKSRHLLGVHGVHSPLPAPAHGPTEVVGQREDVMKCPCATHLGWERAWSTLGRHDGAGALLWDPGEGAGVNGLSFSAAVLSRCRKENLFMEQGGDRASFGWHHTSPSRAESTTAGAVSRGAPGALLLRA